MLLPFLFLLLLLFDRLFDILSFLFVFSTSITIQTSLALFYLTLSDLCFLNFFDSKAFIFGFLSTASSGLVFSLSNLLIELFPFFFFFR